MCRMLIDSRSFSPIRLLEKLIKKFGPKGGRKVGEKKKNKISKTNHAQPKPDKSSDKRFGQKIRKHDLICR